jgi:TolA-binding protein
MRYLVGLILILNFYLQACTHHQTKTGKSKIGIKSLVTTDKSKHLKSLNSRDEVSNEQLVSANKKSIEDQQVNPDEEVNKNWSLLENDSLYFELSGEKYENLTSQEIYNKIVEKYRSSDFKALEAFTNLLLVKYNQSRFADNALYLQGMLAFTIKAYPKSLESFQKIISEYPNGNKAVSALFAKGILYKKMNLKIESENVLGKVKAKYPGSPESLRAAAELK